jgi:hypothetical protein
MGPDEPVAYAMNRKRLEDSRDLYDYLLELAGELHLRGRPDLEQRLTWASGFATGSPSEFLHEAQEALKQVRSNGRSELKKTEFAQVNHVIRQIEVAFIKVGGA